MLFVKKMFTCDIQTSRACGLCLEIAGRRALENSIRNSLNGEAGATGERAQLQGRGRKTRLLQYCTAPQKNDGSKDGRK